MSTGSGGILAGGGGSSGVMGYSSVRDEMLDGAATLPIEFTLTGGWSDDPGREGQWVGQIGIIMFTYQEESGTPLIYNLGGSAYEYYWVWLGPGGMGMGWIMGNGTYRMNEGPRNPSMWIIVCDFGGWDLE